MGRHVMMVAHTFPPLGSLGGSIRLVSFLKYLTRKSDGWLPTVITTDVDRDLLLLKCNSWNAVKLIPDDVKILRAHTAEPKLPRYRPSGLANLHRKFLVAVYRLLSKWVLVPDEGILWENGLRSAVRDELSKETYSAIYVTGPPFSALYIVALIAKEVSLPLVLDIKDDWISEERFSSRSNRRRLAEECMEAECIKIADRVITVTATSNDIYRKRYPQSEDKFTCITNGCDIDEFRPFWTDRPPRFEKFTIIHAGVIGGSIRDASGMIQALANLIGEQPELKGDIEFIVFGRIGRDLLKLIDKNGLDEIVRCEEFLGRQAYIRNLISAHLPMAVNIGVPQGTVPGKLYEYWASGNRQLLLGSSDSEAARLVEQYDIGDVVDPYDVDGIANVILDTWEKARKGSMETVNMDGLNDFDRKKLTSRLEEVFNTVVH